MNFCPACGGELATPSNQPYIVKDHSVTGANFNLLECRTCELLKTDFNDFANIEQYYESADYVSHQINYLNPIHLIYGLARIFTTDKKEKMLRDILHDKSLLDYGCGTGFFLSKLKKKGWQIAGVEPNDKARAQASRITGETIAKSLEDVNNHYAGITLWHVLEHTPNPTEVLKDLKEHIKPGGKIIIAVPNHKSADAAYYSNYWAGYDVPRHLWHFTRKSMSKLARVNNLTVEEIKPMPLDSYYVSLLSEKYKVGKYTPQSLIRAFQLAGQSNKKASITGEYSSLIYILSR